MSLISQIISQLVNGLQSGSIYALVALGYSMVYGIILLLNFAHGRHHHDRRVCGVLRHDQLQPAPLAAVLLAVIACTLLGALIEKIAYTPLRSAPRLSLLITAIGVSFLLENGAQLVFGAGAKNVPSFIDGGVQIGGVYLSYVSVVTILVSVASMVVLTFLVQKTKLGKAMRAVSEDMGAAQLMGISLNRTISFTFAVARRWPVSVRCCTSAPMARPAPPWAPCWA